MRRVRGEALRSTSRNWRNSSTNSSRGGCRLVRSRSLLLRFFDLVSIVTRSAELTFENRRRAGRDQLVSLQHELGIDAVTGRLINIVAAEEAIKSVFVVVVEPEVQLLAIRRELFVFIQHHQLRGAPGLSGPAHIAPEFEIRLVIASADEVVARRLRLDLGKHREPRLMDSFRHRLAAREKTESEDEKTIFQRQLHFPQRRPDGTLYRSFLRVATREQKCTKAVISEMPQGFVRRDSLPLSSWAQRKT